MADQEKVARLKEQAKKVRKEILTMIHTAQSGHPGGSLSATDIMTALYFDELNLDPQNPKWPDRDRLVLSKGHVCPVLYTCLAMKGYFPTIVHQMIECVKVYPDGRLDIIFGGGYLIEEGPEKEG